MHTNWGQGQKLKKPVWIHSMIDSNMVDTAYIQTEYIQVWVSNDRSVTVLTRLWNIQLRNQGSKSRTG